MSSKPVIKYGKVQTRPMHHLRRKPTVKELVKMSSGDLTDLSGNHKVTIYWNLNEPAQRDKIFKLQVDDKVIYLDLEELTYFTRVMFQ